MVSFLSELFTVPSIWRAFNSLRTRGETQGNDQRKAAVGECESQGGTSLRVFHFLSLMKLRHHKVARVLVWVNTFVVRRCNGILPPPFPSGNI